MTAGELLAEPKAEDAGLSIQASAMDDFVSGYADFADVFEAPKKVHEWVACQLIASAMNGNVFIPWGEVRYPLDLQVLLLSESGQGRNTITDVALKVVEAAGIKQLIHNVVWGSSQAFYQQLADLPCGLYVWPELSVVLRTFNDPRFSGVKEWFTDRYDNLRTPPNITYRRTGKKQDTPPIKFGGAPRINVLATSSRDWFINGLEQEDTTGGFIPRWLLVLLGPSERLLSKPRATNRELVPALAARLKAISELHGDAELSEVEGMYDEWYCSAHARFAKQPNPALAMPFFHRLRGQVLKLAVIFEVSRSGSLKVSDGAMRRAIQAARKIEQTIFEILPTGMNREGSEVEKMAERIRNAGAAGLLRRWMAEERQSDRRPCERCPLWCPDAAWVALPMPRDEKRALQASRRAEYGAENGGRNRAHPAGCDEAWDYSGYPTESKHGQRDRLRAPR